MKAANDLTFDHILPRSKGGQTTWEKRGRRLLAVQSALRAI
jgi:5-methylcytosine-specific restriction endonuclease McrA